LLKVYSKKVTEKNYRNIERNSEKVSTGLKAKQKKNRTLNSIDVTVNVTKKVPRYCPPLRSRQFMQLTENEI